MSTKECCPECDSPVRREYLLQTFNHGLPPDVITVCCTVPVFVCIVCGFHYTGWEAEEIRERAVQRARGTA